MDKQLKRYYKQRQHGGRSTAARVADGIMLRLIFAFASYLWFQSNVKNQVIAIALTAATSLLFFIALRLWRGLSFDKFVKKERERLRDVVLRERFLLLPEGAFLHLCAGIITKRPDCRDARLWCSQRATPIDEDTVLNAYHLAQAKNADALVICSLSPCTTKATTLIKRLPIKTTCITPDQLLKEAKEAGEAVVSDEDVEAYIRDEQQVRDARKARMQTQPFATGRTKKYIVCAALLFAASFVTAYALYYRLLAGLCLTLAFAAVLLNTSAFTKARE